MKDPYPLSEVERLMREGKFDEAMTFYNQRTAYRREQICKSEVSYAFIKWIFLAGLCIFFLGLIARIGQLVILFSR